MTIINLCGDGEIKFHEGYNPVMDFGPAHLLPLAWPAGIPPPIDPSPLPYWKNNVQADE